MSKKVGHACPAWLSFTLNSPFRKWFDPPSRILDRLAVKAEDVVVDFGCGSGYYTVPLAKMAKRVIAIDSQNEMLEKASRYAAKNGVKVEFYQSDGKSVPVSDSVADLIFLRRVFHELDDKQAVLKELTRLLKRKGRLVIMEKTKGLTPVGPPRVAVSEIADAIKNAGLEVSGKIELGNETVVIGKR